MFFTTSTLAAALGLASVSSAHMIMSSPTPYGKSTLNNSPLDASGADFPCKQRTGVYDAEGASNTMPLGSTQSLAFVGSATHGGGSCQVSITYDDAPTASSTFKVIHSIEGGCPIKGVAGNNGDDASAVDPDTYSFTIPTSLPTGNATLAWTWFNKIGNREMYMNCAPVSLTSASSKRSDLVERDTAAFDALPNMFTANIGNGCNTVDSTDLAFPAPGDSVEKDGISTATPVAPTGTGCAAAVSGAAATTGASGAGATSASVAASAPAVTSSAAVSGGVFATAASSAQVSAATPVASSAAASVAPVASAAVSSAAPASTGTTGSGTAIAAGTACSPNGLWNCIGGTSFQQCASGTWSAVESVAAGTSCTAGESTTMNIIASNKVKRAIRFSSEHVRRHLQRSS